MKNAGKALIYTAGFVALAVATHATVRSPVEQEPKDPKQEAVNELSRDNPYGAIVERNVFDLHDPVVVDKTPEKPKEPPANIKLTGILTIFGHRQAMFIVNEQGTPGKQASTRSLILSEGQRDGVLEVLQIDPKARTAKIKNEDIEALIHIETNKAAATGGPGAGTGGGQPAVHGGQPGQHGGMGNPRGENIPVRPLRTEAQPSAPGNNYGNGAVAPQQAYGGYTGGGATVQPQQTTPALTPEEQATLIEAQRAQSLAGQADPNLALILPPTALTPGLNQQNESSTPEPPAPGPTGPTAPQIGIHGSGTLIPH